MASTEEEINPYELLGLEPASTDAEIRKAYRQRSLKVHPDRNPDNPDAARKFHELTQAYELLLDSTRRSAFDVKIQKEIARKARYASFDNKRKEMVDALEERVQAVKKTKLDEQKKKQTMRENELIMEQGRIIREEREKKLRQRQEEVEQSQNSEGLRSELRPPPLGPLDKTLQVKFKLSSRPDVTTSEAISALLAPFGPTEISDILVSLKPSPPKKPKRLVALVPFRQIGDAFAAVCASGREERGLKEVEISWVEGEPKLIGWLKKAGKLGSGKLEVPQNESATSASSSSPTSNQGSSAFSSFPSTFPDIETVPLEFSSSAPALDYESLTLMRLRQAERERLEREIREQEVAEGD